jgi:dipeptidyl aminopeptidase/acylaminoacyl peptidase
MKTRIIERAEIKLNESQTKMIISGWGNEVIKNSIVEKIAYISDGLKIKGYLAYPKNIENKKLPCIIWNRGGYQEKGAIDKFTARGIFGQLASWGYTVFASQYRGNAGSEGKEEFGGDDVNDIINLRDLAEGLDFADKDNWGIEGWSRGGMMTFLTLIKKQNFRCAVLSGAISNIKNYIEENPERKLLYEKLFGKANYETEIKERTIINKIDKLPKIPYLIIHGGNDDTVSPIQSLELSMELYKKEILHRLIIFENGDHFLKSYRREVDELRKMWFNKYLKQ